MRNTSLSALTTTDSLPGSPRRNVPKAIRRVFYRILVFYVFVWLPL